MIIKNHFFMSMIMFTFIMVHFLFSVVHAQNNDEDMAPEMSDTLHPSKALVISVLTVIFTITFFLLAYVRFCRFNPVVGMSYPNPNNIQGHIGSRFSGINRELVEKLPFFRFSSLKGSKEGLECTVCLSKFEDSEVLRLLPKCQHAFHINCIDKWLESHSTCPLCRYRVEPGDIKSNVRSLSFGSLRVPSNLTEEPNLEIYIQREPSHRRSSRFGFLEFSKSKKQGEEGGSGSNSKSNSNNNNDMNKNNHKFNHRIVVSDVVTRSRWSDLNSSDLLSLSMEMLNDASSARFSPEKIVQGEYSVSVDDEDENSFTALNSSNKNKDCGKKRSMSEIANVPRFAEIMTMKKQNSSSSGVGREEERFLRIWMPIARRTVQWFARRQRNYYDGGDELSRHKHLGSNV